MWRVMNLIHQTADALKSCGARDLSFVARSRALRHMAPRVTMFYLCNPFNEFSFEGRPLLVSCSVASSSLVSPSGMAQFKCKPSSNIQQDFPNHFLSLWSETGKRHQSKFSALRSLAETITKHAFIENPSNVHLGNFQRHWKWPPPIAYLWGLQYVKGRKCNYRDNGELIQCCI